MSDIADLAARRRWRAARSNPGTVLTLYADGELVARLQQIANKRFGGDLNAAFHSAVERGARELPREIDSASE